MTHGPQRAGILTREGVPYCRATGKRVMPRREAVRLARKARRRGEVASEYHCTGCGGWHYGHTERHQSRRRWRRR